MSNLRPTKIKLEYNEFKAVTASMYGSNQDVIAFNMNLIAIHYPEVAEQLMGIFADLPLWEEKVVAWKS